MAWSKIVIWFNDGRSWWFTMIDLMPNCYIITRIWLISSVMADQLLSYRRHGITQCSPSMTDGFSAPVAHMPWLFGPWFDHRFPKQRCGWDMFPGTDDPIWGLTWPYGSIWVNTKWKMLYHASVYYIHLLLMSYQKMNGMSLFKSGIRSRATNLLRMRNKTRLHPWPVVAILYFWFWESSAWVPFRKSDIRNPTSRHSICVVKQWATKGE